MKRQWKGFVAGLIVAAVFFTMGLPALAATVRQINATYSGIKITLNGTLVTPKDASGAVVEPFSVNGTTYLPVRAVADALGLEVGWDGETQTVKLSNSGTGTTPTSSNGTVIFEQNGIKITYLGFSPDNGILGGYNINLRIENSTSKNYTVQVRDLSANGIMADCTFSCNVTSGKTANDSIWIYNMEEKGITPPITTAEFTFHIFNSENWEDRFDSGIITVK